MRYALITGSCRGLGLEIAKQLLTQTQDVSVIMTSRREQTGREIAKNLGLLVGDKRRTLYYPLDVTLPDNIQYLKTQIESVVTPTIRFLVNNAGVLITDKPQTDESSIRVTMNTNFFGALHMCSSFQNMMHAEQGRIVNISNKIVQLSSNPYLRSIPLIHKNFENDLFSESNNMSRWTIFNLEQLMRELTAQMIEGTLITEELLSKIPQNTHFPNCSYLVSKVGINALTKIYAAELERLHKHVLVNGMY
jgi:NAD(P)-dependent dehydrogenase (short-subunit alcohol dehydrogenase family)